MDKRTSLGAKTSVALIYEKLKSTWHCFCTGTIVSKTGAIEGCLMNVTSWLCGLFAATVLLLAGVSIAQPPIPPQEKQLAVGQQGVEVQARGPIHEAFAEPTVEKQEPS